MQECINLLSPTIVERFQRKRAIAVWSKIIVLVLVATVVTISWGRVAANRYRQHIDSEKLASGKPRSIRNENVRLQRQMTVIRRYETQQKQARSTHSPLAVLSLLAKIKNDVEGMLEIESLDFVEHVSEKKPAGESQLVLEVKTDSTANSAKILQMIRDCEYFQHVRLDGALSKVTPSSSDLTFSIRCTF